MVSVKIYALYLTNVPGLLSRPSPPSPSLLSPLACCIIVDVWWWLWLVIESLVRSGFLPILALTETLTSYTFRESPK